jgi:hypothetical protein
LLGQRLDRGHQTALVTGVAIQRLAEHGYVALPRGRQRQHPLLEVGAVIARVAVGHRQRVRVQLRIVLPRHREGGGVHVDLARCNAKPLPRLPGDAREQCRGIMGVEPVQRPPQAVVV